ncbi:MAG: exopolysaccharide biosynthesis polyprenyl glycosylphosphotransferase [bacterium]
MLPEIVIARKSHDSDVCRGLAVAGLVKYYEGMREKSPMTSLWLAYLACDSAAIVAAYSTTVYLRFFSEWGRRLFGALMDLMGVQEPVLLGPAMQLFYVEGAFRIISVLLVTICFLYGFLELYAGRRFLFRRPVALNVILANLVALGLYYCYFYARVNTFHPRTVFATVAFFNIVFCILFRAGLDRFLQVLHIRFNIDQCRAILVGGDARARFLDELITEIRPQGVCIAGRVESAGGMGEEALVAGVRDSVARHRAHMIIFADAGLGIASIMRIIQLSEELGVVVKVYSQDMDILLTKAGIRADVVRGMPLVHFALPSGSRAGEWLRKELARMLAAVLFVVLLPLLLLVALVVKVTSRGPVMFLQERMGVNRVPFRIYKFRTMRHMADEEQAAVEEYNESGAGLFKIRRDPRVTPVGRFLRRFSLDELPQLVNVMRGEMTLVGPRPLPRRDFENYYEDWHYIRHGGLPGLTCLWQVSGRSELDFHSMCLLDVYYLRNHDFVLDLKILLRTVVVVVFAKGAY